MPPHSRHQLASRRTRRQLQQRRRNRRVAASMLVPAALTGLVMGVLWLGTGGSAESTAPRPAPAPALGPGARPPDLTIARAGQVQLRLPVDPNRLTAIAFHPLEDPRALELEPTGPLDHHDAPREDRPGPERAGVDVGAPAGTMVYAPVDGIVTAVSDYVVRGRVFGHQIGIEPLSATGVVVLVTHVEPHPGVRPPAVGEAVQAGRTALGQVPDLAPYLDQEISRFTADGGNHVSIQVSRIDGP